MSSGPAAAEAFWRDLNSGAQAAAKANGTSPSHEIMNHVYARLIARAFTAGPDDWVVDGGRSMVIRYPGSRPTTDLDMSTTAEVGAREAVAAFVDAARADLGDFVEFELRETTQFTSPPGAQLDFSVRVAGRDLGKVEVDVITQTPLDAEPDVRPLPRPLASAGTETDPNVRVRPLVNQIADKVAGMHNYWDGQTPMRAKDLVDVLLMITNEKFSGPALHSAMRNEIDRSLERGQDLRIPERFEVPDPSWHQRFAAAAERARGCPYRVLDAALPLIRAFIDPLLRPDPPNADWDPEKGRWVRAAEAEEQGAVRSRDQGQDFSRGRMASLDYPKGTAPGAGGGRRAEDGESSRSTRRLPGADKSTRHGM